MAAATKTSKKSAPAAAAAKKSAAPSMEFKTGSNVRVTINKTVNRAAAKKTLERLFMTDHAVAGPIEVRSANFKELPKRRGGQIWTKRPNKVHPQLMPGAAATVKATPQLLRDLRSVSDFVEVKNA